MFRPKKSEYPASIYTSRYIESVEHENVMEALSAQMHVVLNLFKNLSEEQASYRYAPEKWSLKQLLGHITDTERIFSYRALAIARGEKQSLLGFDENEYMDDSPTNASNSIPSMGHPQQHSIENHQYPEGETTTPNIGGNDDVRFDS